MFWKKIKEKLEFRYYEICCGIWSSKKGKIYKFVWFLCFFERVLFREYIEIDRYGLIFFYGGGMGLFYFYFFWK